MEHTWKPAVAGILDIISGVGMLFVCFCLMLGGYYASMIGGPNSQWLPALLYALGILFIVVAIIAITGGVFCIQRKVWGLALAGAIAAFFCCFLFGAVSIALILLARSEFGQGLIAQAPENPL